MVDQQATQKKRYPLIDQLRGSAITLMVYFHFCYDLSHFGFYATDFYTNSWWIHLRSIIVTMFMLIVGISLILASYQGFNKLNFWRRVGLLTVCAVLISIISSYIFPGRTIYFGVLHLIVFASVVGCLFLRLKWINLLVGLSVVVIGGLYQNSWFDAEAIHWLGMMTYKPFTEDYAPVFPWFGMVLIGMFLGRMILDNGSLNNLVSYSYQGRISTSLGFMGRHSLVIYLTHQIILFPLISGLAWLT